MVKRVRRSKGYRGWGWGEKGMVKRVRRSIPFYSSLPLPLLIPLLAVPQPLVGLFFFGKKGVPSLPSLPLLTVLSLVTLFTIKEFGIKRVTLVRRGKEGKSKRYGKGAKKRPLWVSFAPSYRTFPCHPLYH